MRSTERMVRHAGDCRGDAQRGVGEGFGGARMAKSSETFGKETHSAARRDSAATMQ
jgi:hypothetical protein